MASKVDGKQLAVIGNLLADKNRPLKERFRALFTLKNVGGPVAIDAISKCFADESALLKHELAYCLGQMQDPVAIPHLIQVLEDIEQEPMVRHEAGEALGAIGHPDVVAVLEKYRNDPVIEVAETCEIALKRVNWLLTDTGKKPINYDNNPYVSVDPSPPAETKDIAKLTEILLNESEMLFERYRAMFALRNIQTMASINALGKGLKCKSALFRHEIAFVLGQIQNECSIQVLAEHLCDQQESEMVRHECAEALGAIATEECIDILTKYSNDEKQVVKESCVIALDMCEYENSPEFQYANALATAENK